MHLTYWPIYRPLVVLAALSAFGCTPPTNEETPQQSPAAAPPIVAPTPTAIPKPEAPLDRESMILAALRAATAAALGQDDAARQAELKGKRFEVRIRFGCSGGGAKGQSGWTFDATGGALRARVVADVSSDFLNSGDFAEEAFEGVVGFTLRRPWMLTDGCPDPRFAAMANGPAIAIAQLFTASDSRVQRPEESYETVAQLTPEELPTQGLNLVINGRLKLLADGRAIRCAPTKGPPSCIVSSVIDRVAVEDPVRGKLLAEWGAN